MIEPHGSQDGRVTQVVLAVHGMHCDACGALITETLDEEPAITEVEVTREPDEVRVVFDATRIGVEEIAAVIDALGYTARLPG